MVASREPVTEYDNFEESQSTDTPSAMRLGLDAGLHTSGDPLAVELDPSPEVHGADMEDCGDRLSSDAVKIALSREIDSLLTDSDRNVDDNTSLAVAVSTHFDDRVGSTAIDLDRDQNPRKEELGQNVTTAVFYHQRHP